ncbi:hypothetical protein [Marinobacter similis]|uniref:hypothetical protein n=1 Tax=Marinobacter similis TaxID=1420916 RepID=UPI000AE689C0|nr:hypothetical protein [Marinobacter similis]
MFKKTLISVAVASSLGLTGCFDSGDSGSNANPDYKITDTTIDQSLVRPIFDPSPISKTFDVPTHFDLLLLLGATTGENHDFTAPASGPEPVSSGLNALSGFSTTSAFNVRFDGELNPDTVIEGQTVSLIALDTASPLEGTSAPLALPPVNPEDITGIAPGADQPNYRLDVVDVDGGRNNAIRVTPLEPLQEQRKYLVLVSDGVEGANGKNIDQSVQGRALSENPDGLPLDSITDLVAGLNDLGRQILDGSGLDVALAYTFTTNADAEVLRTMLAPSISGTKLGQQVGFTAQLKAVRDVYNPPGTADGDKLNFSELSEKLGELGAKAALVASGDLDISTLPAKEQQVIARLGELNGITTPAAIETAIGEEVADGTIHLPQPRPSYFFDPKRADELTTILALSAGNQIKAAAAQVRVSEGAIALPYFQSLPGETGAGITDGSWQGNEELEEGLNERLDSGGGVFQFLRDGNGTLNINGNFPFAEQQATVTTPVVVFHPAPLSSGERPTACADPSKPNGVTIFQHGITVDRSVSMLPAILLAQSSCQAIVAIDQPLHGLAGAAQGLVPGSRRYHRRH